MNRNVVIAKAEVNLKEASEVMSKYHIGSLVISGGKKNFGILTSGDIIKAIANGRDPERTPVDNVMSKKVITIEPDKGVEDAVELMVRNRIKKLPVVDQGKLLGIVTASDIIAIEPKLLANLTALISVKIPGYTGG